jgi:HEAT repeat protein
MARLSRVGFFLLIPLVVLAARADDDVLRPQNLSQRQRQYILKEVLPKLASADFEERHRGLLAVARLGQTAVPFLLKLLETESDPVPRRMAILSLGQIGDPAGRSAISKCLRDAGANQDELVAACFAAGVLGGSECAKELRNLLEEKVPSVVRRSAAIALARLGDKEAVPLLMRLATRESIDLTRAAFDLSLGLLGDEAAYKHLCQESGHDNALVRRAAVLGLANLPRTELAKEDPVLRPESDVRRRDEVVEVAYLASLAPKSGQLAVDLAKQPEKARERQEDLWFAAAFSPSEGAVPMLEDAVQHPKSPQALPPALLAAAQLSEHTRVRSLALKALEHSDPAVRHAAILALFVSGIPLDQELTERLSVPDSDRNVRHAALLYLAASGASDLTARLQKNEWPADDRPLADAIASGKKDVRLAIDELEAQAFERRGRFGYRLAGRRDRVLFAALELDRIFRQEGRGPESVSEGSGSTPKPGGGTSGGTSGGNSGDSGSGGSGSGGSGSGGSGSGNAGDGGESGSGGSAGGGAASPPEAKAGFRRRGTIQNERIEHDLRLFLTDYAYFPRFWAGRARL